MRYIFFIHMTTEANFLIFSSSSLKGIGSVVGLQVTTPDEDGKLLVSWNPPESDNNCAVFAYAVTVDFIGVASCTENLLTQNGSYIVNTTSKMVENLAPYSRYFIRVKALLNYGGDDVEWAEVTGTTKASSKLYNLLTYYQDL